MALIIVGVCVTLFFAGIVALGEWGDAHQKQWQAAETIHKAPAGDRPPDRG